MSSPPDRPSWPLFWAKTDRHADGTLGDAEWTRPLWAHLLDVAHTALLLWERRVPEGMQRRIAEALGLSVTDAGQVLSFWIGLHDIGKAIPTFQALHPASMERLREAGLSFKATGRLHHGHASIAILYLWLERREQDRTARSFYEHIAAFVGFHHGRLYPQGNPRFGRPGWRLDALDEGVLGNAAWQRARSALLEAVERAWFDRYPVTTSEKPITDPLPTWMLGFAGWVTLADWLGSMATCFDRDTGPTPADYLDRSRAGAAEALKRAGFDDAVRIEEAAFETLFAFPPRPLQAQMMDMPLPDASRPTLTIVEAPTGEGKTEGAFGLAARQQVRARRGGGLYVAMPTQATSNGLYQRTVAFLDKAMGDDAAHAANFLLVHGNADLHPEQSERIVDVAALATLFDEDDDRGRVRAVRWFLQKKRSLLAPFGLGTVDQALLSVLYGRHFFLRLFGLAGKTIVFDEVHAYDLYMQRLFLRLLAWLREMDCHVIVLSATLPAALRRRMLAAWGAKESEAAPQTVPYPAVWQADTVQPEAQCWGGDAMPTAWQQHARLQRHDPDPDAVARSVVAAMQAGAVVGVICNTVRRAQDVYCKVQDRLGEGDAALLFHARYPFDARQKREDAALARFGKDRPDGGAVLVATQVAEQSLDLDFDVLLTDLAPVDLLLQRAGRLHRHLTARPPASRPIGYQTPTVHWLCSEAARGTLPNVNDVSGHGNVYDRLTLWKTWRTIEDRDTWRLPDDYRALVEAVYDEQYAAPDDLSPEAVAQWDKAAVTLQKALSHERNEAEQRRVVPPKELLKVLHLPQRDLADEDDETTHPDLRAVTRLGDSVDVVVLHANGDGVFLDVAHQQPAPLSIDDPACSPTAVRALLGNGLRLSFDGVVQHLRALPSDQLPEAWQAAADATPALRYKHPLVFNNRVWIGGGYRIEFDDDLGLVVTRS